MIKATWEEVEKGAAEYLGRVIDVGETIVIYRDGLPVAEIRPVTGTETGNPTADSQRPPD